MRKSILLIIAFVACCGIGYAQRAKSFYHTSYRSRNSGSFGRNTGLGSFSYGFPNLAVVRYGHKGNNLIGFGPVYAKYEHSVADEIGLGVQTALSAGRLTYGNNEHERIRTAHFAVLGYYHFNKLIPVKRLDVYVGTGLAYRSREISYSDNTYIGDTEGTLHLSGKIGLRFYVNSNIALYAEAGYDEMSDINLGVAFRFR